MANDNDTSRRDFFLIRAECIAHYFIENPTKETFSPSDQKKVQVKCGDENCEIRETELFAKQHPEITLPPYSIGMGIKYSPKFWKDWFRGSQFAIPTIMLGAFFILLLGWLLGIILILVLILVLGFLWWVLGRIRRRANQEESS